VIHSPPKLPDQVRDALRVKHYSMRTELAYVNCIKRFMLFYDRRYPQAMGAPELAVFLESSCRCQRHLLYRPIPCERNVSSDAMTKQSRTVPFSVFP
jgi:hypothetical protein